MIGKTSLGNLDPVAMRLSAAGDNRASTVTQWMHAQQQRKILRRRATWCGVGAWLMMTAAALIGSYVAIDIAIDVREIFTDDLGLARPTSVIVVPVVLLFAAGVLTVGGLWGWLTGSVPGYSQAFSALDWSACSDAVRRLLQVGCTYPEAFRTAASAARTKASRSWLMAAASRVESGVDGTPSTPGARGDLATLELMIDAAQSEPQKQWGIAAEHFWELASRRMVLLIQTTPVIATIVSGILVWISISATLGWMWRAVIEMIRGFS